jgi:hypothetical protein
MRAFITGVGNICGPEGPGRILREGKKILLTVSRSWGRTRDYVNVLIALENAVSNKRLQNKRL